MAEASWQHITSRREVDRITEKKKKCSRFRISARPNPHKYMEIAHETQGQDRWAVQKGVDTHTYTIEIKN